MKSVIEHYEAALKEAFPSGATGAVFHHWNEARKALNQPAQQEPVGVFREDDDVGHVDLLPHQQLKLKDGDKLYTRPQAREPLTDE